ERVPEPRHVGRTQAQLAAALDQVEVRPRRLLLLHPGAGAVGRAVVHDEHLEPQVQRLEGGDHQREVLDLVVGGNDDERSGHAGSGTGYPRQYSRMGVAGLPDGRPGPGAAFRLQPSRAASARSCSSSPRGRNPVARTSLSMRMPARRGRAAGSPSAGVSTGSIREPSRPWNAATPRAHSRRLMRSAPAAWYTPAARAATSAQIARARSSAKVGLLNWSVTMRTGLPAA